MAGIKTFQDLKVYQLSRELAMDLFRMSSKFPAEERYSLVDQLRRSSRSVAGNIAEGWGKRRYENLFKRHMIDAAGSLEETKSWLLFSTDCGYISKNDCEKHLKGYDVLGAALFSLHDKWRSKE